MKKRLYRAVALLLAVLNLIPLFAGCGKKEEGLSTDFCVVGESPYGYTPVLSSTRLIQMGNDCIYFAGEHYGIFKYDIATGEVGEICTDPMCKHYGSDDSCRIAMYMNLHYFRAFSDMLIYSTMPRNGKNANLYGFEAQSMKNAVISDNPSSTNWYCVSNKYVYFDNITARDGVNYFNHKQVSIADGTEKVFGEETEGGTPYHLMGAIGGKLYAQDKDRTVTYICSEDNPGEFELFWEKPISYIWAGENDLFFKSSDPEDDDGKYYFYHTDTDGNIIKRQELVGGMKWCSFYDGRHLYYIPSEETTFVNNDTDKTVKTMHWREMYCLDMETGERTVAFTFNGDYETMGLGFSMGNDIIVRDGKIYTYKITQQRGYLDKETNQYVVGGPTGFADGIVIIDMENGDITHVKADYTRFGDFSTNSEHRAMRLEGEDEVKTETSAAEISSAPDVIVIDPTLMFNDTDALPLFRMKSNDSADPDRYEGFTMSGEVIDTCFCDSSPCICGQNRVLSVNGNTIYSIAESSGGKTVFNVFDITDRAAVKRSSVTVAGISLDTHTISRSIHSPSCYFVRLTQEEAEKRGVLRMLSVLDMSEAASGKFTLTEYPALTDGNYSVALVRDGEVYCIFTDFSANLKVVKAEAGESTYTTVFETKSQNKSRSTYRLIEGADGELHLFCMEYDTESKYGYSLYQYIYRQGKELESILRVKNVCDYIISGEYCYYAVNDPANSREFPDQDRGNVTFTDMTGGIIYRIPVGDVSAAGKAVWSVGDYYLYGFTPNSKPTSKNGIFNTASTPIFIQSTEGGIALQANKKVGEEMSHVFLLIGNTENGVSMTVVEGSKYYGTEIVSDRGGTTCNWGKLQPKPDGEGEGEG